MHDSEDPTRDAATDLHSGWDRHAPKPARNGVGHPTHGDPPLLPRESGQRWMLPSGAGVSWVRASDLLTHGTGGVVGRGITWVSAANRWPRLHPQSTPISRRAIAQKSASRRDRASRLAPLTAFGARPHAQSHPAVSR